MVVLSESPSSPTSAYAASMAVILLRTLSRSGEAGMAAFVGCGGVGALLRMLPALREDRALCLALYLLSDVTRRSGEALGQAVEAGGVPLVVAALRCVALGARWRMLACLALPCLCLYLCLYLRLCLCMRLPLYYNVTALL